MSEVLHVNLGVGKLLASSTWYKLESSDKEEA